ncbi:MAG: hypothetical protein DI539_06965 [Flavobacterium psychrophilum]|nr:MAG: hypothetical protein DI539_06965 [Flavobacterium psychrophilum]
MRYYAIIISCAIGLIIACSTKNNIPSQSKSPVVAASKNDTVRIANDSLEYEVIIIDPGFNTWLASRARLRGYYGQSYLENKNRFWVTEWNLRAMNPQRFGELYQMPIDYKPQINYGYEVNYLLFNYLVFFQQTNNQKLGGVIPQ